MSKRQVNVELWAELERLARGSESEKLKFIDAVFDKYRELPTEAEAVIVGLAKSDQPEGVRIRLAERLLKKGNISFGLYSDILDALHEDPNPTVKKLVESEEERVRVALKPLREAAEVVTKSVMEGLKGLESINVTIPKIELPTPKIEFPDPSAITASQRYLVAVSGMITTYEELARRISALTPSYYPPKLLLEIPKVELRVKSRNTLIKRLEACQKGRDSWQQFQDICKDILEYLFVPPLNPPLEQSRTASGLQIRDFVLDIPYDAGGFWADVRIAHRASAVIVDAKNYSEPLPPDEIVLNAKYFGKSRCGLFGIIFCRSGLSESCRKEQVRLWRDEEKMIVCLDDSDIIRMILLKEDSKEPELVLDEKRRELRRSIE